jgi:hypothetical protein
MDPPLQLIIKFAMMHPYIIIKLFPQFEIFFVTFLSISYGMIINIFTMYIAFLVRIASEDKREA